MVHRDLPDGSVKVPCHTGTKPLYLTSISCILCAAATSIVRLMRHHVTVH